MGLITDGDIVLRVVAEGLSLGDVAGDYGAKAVGRTLEEISENTPDAH